MNGYSKTGLGIGVKRGWFGDRGEERFNKEGVK